MICELNDIDWYFGVGPVLIAIGAMALSVTCMRDDLNRYERRLETLEEKVEHNHKHYEREVLLLLKEALNQSPRSSVNSMCDNNSIPGGE